MNDKPASESTEVVTSKGIGSSALLGSVFDVFVSEKITIKCDAFRVRTAQYTDEDGQKMWEMPSVREVGSSSAWYSIGNKERRRLESLGAVFAVDT